MAAQPKNSRLALSRRAADEKNGVVFAASADAPAPAGSVTTDDNGQPRRRYVKDLIRAGRWTKGLSNITFDVPKQRLKHWADTFSAMKAAGVKVPVPLGHTNDPAANRGEVVDMYVEGDTLYGVIDLIGNDALPLASRSEVSIFAEPVMMAGDGKRFDDAITHVALVTDPVVNKQDGFVPVAASRGTVRVPVMRLSMTEGNAMDWKELAAMLGIDITGLDDTTGPAKVKEAIAAMTAQSKEAATKLTEADKQVAAAKAETAAAVAASRTGSALPTVHPDVVDTLSGAIKTRAKTLIASHGIVPKVANGLAELFAAQPIALSRTASNAVGFKGERSLADTVFDLLEQNTPTAQGEMSGPQIRGTALGRTTPGNTAAVPDAAAIQKDIDERAARIYGGKKTAKV